LYEVVKGGTLMLYAGVDISRKVLTFVSIYQRRRK